MSHYKIPEEERPAAVFPHSGTVVMNCGTGSGLALPVEKRGGKCFSQPSLVAGTVSLNSRGLTCPTIKVDFSSMINFKVESREGEYLIRLIFQLSRACDGGQKIPLGTWVYEKEVDIERRRKFPVNNVAPAQASGPSICRRDVDMEFKESFGFTWCGCCDCPDCCQYIVEIIDIDTDDISCLSLTNVGINAIASGACPARC